MKIFFQKTNCRSHLPFLSVILCFICISCGSGKNSRNLSIPGVDGPSVTLNQDSVIISIVYENLNIEGGLRYMIPKYSHSFIEISPDLQSSGTLMAVSIDLDDVFSEQLNQLDPLTLPGGRPLPGITSGSLPGLAFSIEKFKNIGLYLGQNVFAIWVPVKGLNMNGAIITTRFYADKLRLGNLSLVGEDENGENSGFLLMLDLKGKIEGQLRKVAKRY